MKILFSKYIFLRTAQEELRFTNVPNGGRIQSTWNATNSNITSFYEEIYDQIIIDGTVHNLLKTNASLFILGAIIVIAVILTLVRSFLFFKLAMVSSKNLHKTMLHRLMQAPMKFFNTNTCGRILNRFSKDIGSIDEILPAVLIDTLQVSLIAYS